jgi:hypothetical protein
MFSIKAKRITSDMGLIYYSPSLFVNLSYCVQRTAISSFTYTSWAPVPIALMVFAEAFYDVSGEDQK